MYNFGWGIFTTIMLLLVGHWLPWFKRLTRIQAYAYGCAAILAGQAVAFCPVSVELFVMIAAFPCLGGACVIGAYWYDGWGNKRARRYKGAKRGDFR